MGRSIVILGAGGMLGSTLAERLREQGSARGFGDVRALGREACDVTSRADLERAIGEDVGLVFNCAAWTDVDGAEEHEAEATRLNGEAVGLIAERCGAVGATLVQYSTDYVFDGTAREPIPVEAPRKPLGAYGRSKAAGEEALEASGAEHLLIRTSWLYAERGKNFVRTIARLCREREALKVVDDQWGRPTACGTLASISLGLVERGARGIWHGCDGGIATWFQMAERIAGRFNPACAVTPCTTEDFPRPAARPRYSVLDLSKTEGALGPLAEWTEALDRTLDELEAQGALTPEGRRG